MWVLTQNERHPDITHRLLCNRDLLVGKKTDIRLDADDKSISRQHAKIRINYSAQDVSRSDGRGQITVCDLSKYGTFVNDTRLDKEAVVTVQDGDIIRFGLQWNSWTFRWKPMAVVASLLSRADREALNAVLADLGLGLSQRWVATVFALVMPTFKLSVKAAQALASATMVVTAGYFAALRDSVAHCATAADPPCADFEPRFDEPTLNANEHAIAVDCRRRRLFSETRFIFADRQQHARLALTVELAGGRTLMLEDCGMSTDQLASSVDVAVVDAGAGCSGGGDLAGPKQLAVVGSALKRHKRRLIHEQEIGLALLRVSTDRDCNPAFNYTATFLPAVFNTQSQVVVGQVLARDTQAPITPRNKGKALSTEDEDGMSMRTVSSYATPATSKLNSCKVVPPTPETSDIIAYGVSSTTRKRHRSPSGENRPETAGDTTACTPATRRNRMSPVTTSILSVNGSTTTEAMEGRGSVAGASTGPSCFGVSQTSVDNDFISSRKRPHRSDRSEDVDMFKRPCLSVGAPLPRSSAGSMVNDDFAFDLESVPVPSYSIIAAPKRSSTTSVFSDVPSSLSSARGGSTRNSSPTAVSDDDRKVPTNFDLPSSLNSKAGPSNFCGDIRGGVNSSSERNRDSSSNGTTSRTTNGGTTGSSVCRKSVESNGWLCSKMAPITIKDEEGSALVEVKKERRDSLSEDDEDEKGLIGGCLLVQMVGLMRELKTSELADEADDLCSRAAAADLDASAAVNFKRFRRKRDPGCGGSQLCPRIIGGSDLFVAGSTTVTAPSGGSPEDRSAVEARRWGEMVQHQRRVADEEEQMWKVLETPMMARRRRR